MNQTEATQLVNNILTSPFSRGNFGLLAKNIFKRIDEDTFSYHGSYIPEAYRGQIKKYERLGKFRDSNRRTVDVLVVYLEHQNSLDRARSMQRNFVARYLNGGRGGALKDAALVAFVSPDESDWRFSLVRMEYKDFGKSKDLSPARRLSFLVGVHEQSHTARRQLLPLLLSDSPPSLDDLVAAFNVEKVGQEFFERYKELFLELKESVDKLVDQDKAIAADFSKKEIKSEDFSKKLLGQVVFLYFLQKKGWLGVPREKQWGAGPKDFLRKLFAGDYGSFQNFFNEMLEPLFYEALATERSKHYYDHLKSKIPFLNGGLFEPLNDYDWVDTDVELPNEIFSNTNKTKDGDTGTGILDVFDRYNFTVKEDEPLDKEVAVDPEMLGKVFENLLEVRDRRSKGSYYTPREVVHYMCQESLIDTLTDKIGSSVPRKDLSDLIYHGEASLEHDQVVAKKGETKTYRYKLPTLVRDNAQQIDDALASLTICDPAIGSGAFIVGMMNEIVRTRNVLSGLISKPDRQLYDLKRQAIQHNLYGVDIDLGAVEIAKLRLWLSLIVDEEDISNIKPLPNLDYKVMQGNSLVEYLSPDLVAKSADAERNVLIDQLNQAKDEYVSLSTPGQKRTQREHINNLIQKIVAFDQARAKERQDALLKAQRSQQNLFGAEAKAAPKGKQEDATAKSQPIEVITDQSHFEWRLHFNEIFDDGGFDIVIANPPYISAIDMKKTIPADTLELMKQRYETARGTVDIYILFFELGTKLLRKSGHLVYITPNKYLSAPYAEALRRYFTAQFTVLRLVDLSKIRVFTEASVYPTLTFLKKGTSDSELEGIRPANRLLRDLQEHALSTQRFSQASLSEFPSFIWGHIINGNYGLLKKVVAKSHLIPEVASVNSMCTAKEGYLFDRYIDETHVKGSFKVINTGQVDPYIALWGRRPFKNKGKYLKRPYLRPNKHLSEYRQKMYSSPKLIFAKLAKRTEVVIDLKGEFASQSTNCVYALSEEYDLRFAAAFCNSSIFQFVYATFFAGSRMAKGYFQYQAPQIRMMPMVIATPEEQKPVIALVDKILALKDPDSPKLQGLSEKVDQQFYKLLGLNNQDVKEINRTLADEAEVAT